ncbi:hypothetical protein ACUUL3_15075 [Thiovibrio sp. JS02]
MRIRLAITVLLLFVLLAQVRAMVVALGPVSLPAPAPPETKAPLEARALPADRSISLQPAPPSRMPDFNEGYIFNAERSLKGGGKNGQAQTVENIDIARIQYSGSIITAASTKALLSYGGGIPQQQGLVRGRMPAPQAQKQGFLQVVVGDTVGGYKVAEILPEKIVFSRGGEKIEKFLYDRNKERAVAPPLATPARGSGKEQVAAPASETPDGHDGGGRQGAPPEEGQAMTPATTPLPDEQRPASTAANPAVQQAPNAVKPAVRPAPYPLPTTRPMIIPGKLPSPVKKNGSP